MTDDEVCHLDQIILVGTAVPEQRENFANLRARGWLPSTLSTSDNATHMRPQSR
jgi:hypothetical protein